MKRLTLFSVCLLAIGCSDDGATGGEPDGNPAVGCPSTQDPANPGFFCPPQIAHAWNENGGVFEDLGPANFTCLGAPSTDAPSNVDINMTGQVRDFQEGNPVPDATVEVFANIDIGAPLATATADGNGDYALVIPAGQVRVGFKVAAPDYVDTYLINQYYDPDTLDQDENVDAVSDTTADLLPALIGLLRTDGLGIVAAAFRDCDNNTVSHVVATVSATSGAADHLPGGQSYYFDDGLPTNHVIRQTTNSDGLFVVLELPEAPTAYLQLWGFVDGQDPSTDDMTLLSEMAAPVIGNTVITASAEPLRE